MNSILSRYIIHQNDNKFLEFFDFLYKKASFFLYKFDLFLKILNLFDFSVFIIAF